MSPNKILSLTRLDRLRSVCMVNGENSYINMLSLLLLVTKLIGYERVFLLVVSKLRDLEF